MEIFAFFLLFFIYLGLRLLFTDYRDNATKDTQLFAEGIELVQKKNYADALDYFQKALDKKPNSAVAYAYRAKCYMANQENDKAMKDLNKALNIDYGLDYAYVDKAKILHQIEDLQQAKIELDKAVWHNNKNAEAFRLRGVIHLALRNAEQARDDLQKAAQLGDENAHYYLTHGGSKQYLM